MRSFKNISTLLVFVLIIAIGTSGCAGLLMMPFIPKETTFENAEIKMEENERMIKNLNITINYYMKASLNEDIESPYDYILNIINITIVPIPPKKVITSISFEVNGLSDKDIQKIEYVLKKHSLGKDDSEEYGKIYHKDGSKEFWSDHTVIINNRKNGEKLIKITIKSPDSKKWFDIIRKELGLSLSPSSKKTYKEAF